MKRFSSGVVIGLLVGLLLATAITTLADQPIRLVVNGADITDRFEAKPTIINDRTYVPARPLAEALGATVEWDEVSRAVVIQGKDYQPQNTHFSVDVLSLKDISKLPGVTVGMNEKLGNYIAKDDLKILLQYEPKSQKQTVPISIVKGETIIGQSEAQIIDGRTYLSKDLLSRYGFISNN